MKRTKEKSPVALMMVGNISEVFVRDGVGHIHRKEGCRYYPTWSKGVNLTDWYHKKQ